MPPLHLPIAALNAEGCHLYIAALQNLADLPDLEHGVNVRANGGRFETVEVGVREARTWLRCKYPRLKTSDLDIILKFLCPRLLSSDSFTGGQFFAAIRLCIHLLEGKDIHPDLAYEQARPKPDSTLNNQSQQPALLAQARPSISAPPTLLVAQTPLTPTPCVKQPSSSPEITLIPPENRPQSQPAVKPSPSRYGLRVHNAHRTNPVQSQGRVGETSHVARSAQRVKRPREEDGQVGGDGASEDDVWRGINGRRDEMTDTSEEQSMIEGTSAAGPCIVAKASGSSTSVQSSARASTTLSRLVSSLVLSKPFRCPKTNCNKSYKQVTGLRYHRTHGSCDFAPPKDLEQVQALLASTHSQREAAGEQNAQNTLPDLGLGEAAQRLLEELEHHIDTVDAIWPMGQGPEWLDALPNWEPGTCPGKTAVPFHIRFAEHPAGIICDACREKGLSCRWGRAKGSDGPYARNCEMCRGRRWGCSKGGSHRSTQKWKRVRAMSPPVRLVDEEERDLVVNIGERLGALLMQNVE
ncbi:hypothetical protein CONPUDRAFT_164454 [Coniophora puteana RWD-64-598 SS2]|uniref:C2H2-type domain-containing protein n=1 Tax=Coniophora puteana (strain RWD-64-598) TaxID=741705 RepID=A0A5M3MXS7_CONPW|nr:uncharacterized protein CONPUDRAFT_164454 [Coniophora puteana RWD-64-598 SS2]EIW83535.1 hypothetical protein CONPUDRAFT_164454 [Coniophora puteana RWD-64-598 SS2]